MNIQHLTPGTDYAHYRDKGRDEPFRWKADRVRILYTFKEKLPGNVRETGFAEVLFINKETGEIMFVQKYDYDKHAYVDTEQHRVEKVRARDIAMRWDEYEDEYEVRDIEREKIEREREARRQKEREEWEARERIRNERIERERLEREERERQMRLERERKTEALYQLLESRGIPRNIVKALGDYEIIIDTAGFREVVSTYAE